MKIYLAARYSRHPEMQRVAADLSNLGHAITSRWIQGTHDIHEWEELTEEQAHDRRVQFALEDWLDLHLADCVIAFTEVPGHAPGRNRGCRHVELGAALSSGRRVIVVGHRENVFCCLPQVEFHATWGAAFLALTTERKRGLGITPELLDAAGVPDGGRR